MKFRAGQPIVHFSAANNRRLCITTRGAMKLQDDIPLIPIDNFKDHYVLVFNLTSMHDATEKSRYPELVEEPLRLMLSFIFLLQHVT